MDADILEYRRRGRRRSRDRLAGLHRTAPRRPDHGRPPLHTEHAKIAQLLELLERTEREPAILGATGHLLAVARK